MGKCASYIAKEKEIIARTWLHALEKFQHYRVLIKKLLTSGGEAMDKICKQAPSLTADGYHHTQGWNPVRNHFRICISRNVQNYNKALLLVNNLNLTGITAGNKSAWLL